MRGNQVCTRPHFGQKNLTVFLMEGMHIEVLQTLLAETESLSLCVSRDPFREILEVPSQKKYSPFSTSSEMKRSRGLGINGNSISDMPTKTVTSPEVVEDDLFHGRAVHEQCICSPNQVPVPTPSPTPARPQAGALAHTT